MTSMNAFRATSKMPLSHLYLHTQFSTQFSAHQLSVQQLSAQQLSAQQLSAQLGKHGKISSGTHEIRLKRLSQAKQEEQQRVLWAQRWNS